MDLSEEFTTKTLGKLTMLLDLDMPTQLKVRDVILLQLYQYEITSRETGLIATDIPEKIALFIQAKKLENYSKETLKNYVYKLMKLADVIVKPVATITLQDLRHFIIN